MFIPRSAVTDSTPQANQLSYWNLQCLSLANGGEVVLEPSSTGLLWGVSQSTHVVQLALYPSSPTNGSCLCHEEEWSSSSCTIACWLEGAACGQCLA